MLRANVNRLIRRTWCTSKRIDRLVDHLTLYADFHNRVLLKHEPMDEVSYRLEGPPVQKRSRVITPLAPQQLKG